MTNTPELKMYLTIGIVGMEDAEVREEVVVSPDSKLSSEKNQEIIQARMELAQLKMQIGLAAMLLKLPDFINQIADQDDTVD